MKKVTTVRLLVFLIILVLTYAFMEFFGNTGRSKSLKENLVAIDTLQVTRIRITKRLELTILEKENGRWTVNEASGTSYSAESGKIHNSLSVIQTVKPSRVVTKDPNKWVDFQVDTSGTRIEIFEGDNKSLDIVLGRFGMQGQQKFHTYVRLFKDNEVYAADNFMGFSFPSDAASYRNQLLTDFKSDSIFSVNLLYSGDSSVHLEKTIEGKWLINGEIADSTATASYLRSLSKLNSNNFANISNPGRDNIPTHQAIIDLKDNVQVTIFSYSNAQGDPFITSSENIEGVFSDQTLFDKIYKSKSHFIVEEAENSDL